MSLHAATLDVEDPVLAALARAPFRPLTDEEERLLAEAEAHRGPRSNTEGFMARLEKL